MRSSSRTDAPHWRSRFRLAGGLAVVAACAALLAACGSGAGSGTGASSGQGQSLTIGISDEPGSLDVQWAALAEAWPPLLQVYESLTQLNASSQPAPSLATSWKELTPTSWQFTLRKGVKFQDGEPFNAAAAVFSIKRALNAAENVNLSFYSLVTGAKAQGTDSIVVTTQTPDAVLPTELSFLAMVPPKYVTDHPSQYTRQAEGTGAYEMSSWTPGQEIVLKANPDWWGGKPRYQTVTFKTITDPNVRLQALITGEVDFIDSVDPDSASEAPKTFTAPGNVCLLRPNALVAPFNDVKVRQAANYAIDRATIVDALFEGGKYATTPHGQAISSAVPGYNKTMQDYPYDPAKAKSLLAQSSYKGQPITIYGTSGTWTGDDEVLLTAAKYLQQAGFNVKTDVVDYSVWLTDWRATPRPQLMEVCTSEDTFTGFKVLTNLGTPTGSQSAYSNPAIAAQITAAHGVVNSATRDADLAKIWDELNAQGFLVPVATIDQIWAAQSDVSWNPPADGYVNVNDIIKG